MSDWAMYLAALLCGVVGLAVEYALGFRNGCVSGELRTLDTTISQMRERRQGPRHVDVPETAKRLD